MRHGPRRSDAARAPRPRPGPVERHDSRRRHRRNRPFGHVRRCGRDDRSRAQRRVGARGHRLRRPEPDRRRHDQLERRQRRAELAAALQQRLLEGRIQRAGRGLGRLEVARQPLWTQSPHPGARRGMIRQQGMAGELSPDKLYFWDGARWASALSPDGLWRWDGHTWRPAASSRRASNLVPIAAVVVIASLVVTTFGVYEVAHWALARTQAALRQAGVGVVCSESGARAGRPLAEHDILCGRRLGTSYYRADCDAPGTPNVGEFFDAAGGGTGSPSRYRPTAPAAASTPSPTTRRCSARWTHNVRHRR